MQPAELVTSFEEGKDNEGGGDASKKARLRRWRGCASPCAGRMEPRSNGSRSARSLVRRSGAGGSSAAQRRALRTLELRVDGAPSAALEVSSAGLELELGLVASKSQVLRLSVARAPQPSPLSCRSPSPPDVASRRCIVICFLRKRQQIRRSKRRSRGRRPPRPARQLLTRSTATIELPPARDCLALSTSSDATRLPFDSTLCRTCRAIPLSPLSRTKRQQQHAA